MSEHLPTVIERIVNVRKSELQAASADSPLVVDVSTTIEAIRSAYHTDWEKQKLEYAREFLARTKDGIPLPVLSVCGRGTQEIRYSIYLAYFLDRSKLHGLGASYLDGLLSVLGQSDIDTSISIVTPEKWLGQARGKNEMVDCVCDIVVTCGEHVIFIEQKIKSSESLNPKSETSQLRRYDEAIGSNLEFRDMKQIRIFLTPAGKESSKSPNWQSLSYDDLVEAGLRAYRTKRLSNTAWENLRRFLLDISLGPFDRAEHDIRELTMLAKRAAISSNFKDRLRFDQMVSRNQMLVDLLMEGLW